MNLVPWIAAVFLVPTVFGAAPLNRVVPSPLPDHPGNVFLERETVRIRLPEARAGQTLPWQLYDDDHRLIRSGISSSTPSGSPSLDLGALDIGWYRLELGPAEQPPIAFTTAAVLAQLTAPTPLDSPVCVDSATAWFARDDLAHQRALANLATLAGINWVRDRLRWSDLQPQPGPLRSETTTYDTAATLQHEAGLQVLQVFHDSPAWAQATPNDRGRFAPDLRHVHAFAYQLALRFAGRVQAWEPWNEANVATFGAHTVDQQCSWQKAAWIGFKAGDPTLLVGWNPTAAVPAPQHTRGVLLNETWPYYSTYNIHTYDWAHAYTDLWEPARVASSGRPLWITEADRGTRHLNQSPFFDQDPRLERLKAEYIAQSYASSLFAGAQRHFHFILGHYHEPNGVQFGLLRLDLTPRPAYVALAAVGRWLAGARVLGRWQPAPEVNVVAFRARPDGKDHDVLVAWAEKTVDWESRGQTVAPWPLPPDLSIVGVVDYLGRSLETTTPPNLTSAPVFVVLPAGEAQRLPLTTPPSPPPLRMGETSPVVLQLNLPASATARVEDLPWSEGYVYQVAPGETLELSVNAYNFSHQPVRGVLAQESLPSNWDVSLKSRQFELAPGQRASLPGQLRIPDSAETYDDWVVLRAECGLDGKPVLAFRVRSPAPPPAGG